jgi:hypothetical protein
MGIGRGFPDKSVGEITGECFHRIANLDEDRPMLAAIVYDTGCAIQAPRTVSDAVLVTSVSPGSPVEDVNVRMS